MRIYHLSVGCADASVIKSNSATFLVDCHGIENYVYLLPVDKVLHGVFITHQNHDHHSGLEYLRKNGYSIRYLIYSPYRRRPNDSSVTAEEWDEFNSHRDYFERSGTKLYKPYRQKDFDKPWWDTAGIKIWMLGPISNIADSETREIHDACLIFKVNNNRKCLFTGDASDKSLQFIADNTNHICDDILHASHHGSIEGANLDFIKACDPFFTVISTESGVYENVPHPTALQRYREYTKKKVYRTDVDGTITWD